MICPVLYFLIVVALHFLRPDYHPARRFLSEYAVGKYGALGTFAFWLLAVTTAALTATLLREVRRSSSLVVTCVLLFTISLGFCALALLPTDMSDPRGGPSPVRTPIGKLHDMTTGIISIMQVAVSWLLPWAYSRDDRWRSISRWFLPFAIFFPVTLCAANLVSWQWRGAGQRVVVATGLAWLFANGYLLWRGGRVRTGE